MVQKKTEEEKKRNTPHEHHVDYKRKDGSTKTYRYYYGFTHGQSGKRLGKLRNR